MLDSPAVQGTDLLPRAVALGLHFTRQSGEQVPIPISAEPLVLDPADIRASAGVAARLAAAASKLWQWLRTRPERRVIDAELTPSERRLVDAWAAATPDLATVRVDGALDPAFRAIELNTTIPAMQGYSDIAAQALIETRGRALGLQQSAIEQLVRANGSNARALFDSLQDRYTRYRGGPADAIGLLARRGDAQRGELDYLAAAFRRFGVDARVLHPDELRIDSAVHAQGRQWPLLYRHWFVHHLDQAPFPALEDLLSRAADARAIVLNSPSPQLEAKGLFALLSAHAGNAAAPLSVDERDAIQRHVPWTRVFQPGSTTGVDGEPIVDLPRYVAAQPTRFVIKRSSGYGGRGVLVGGQADSETFAARSKALFGAALGWAEICERAAHNGGFIVQARVALPLATLPICRPQGTQPERLYLDYSAFASGPGFAAQDWNGVCRAAAEPVVNLGSGGALVPLLRRSIAVELGFSTA